MSLIEFLQVIIAVILIYLVLSLLVSEIQEVLASWLEFRAKNLRESIQILLGEVDQKGKIIPYENSFTQQIYQQPQIKSLNQSTSTFISKLPFVKSSKGPSYLTREDFSDAIFEWLKEQFQVLKKENKIQFQLNTKTFIHDLIIGLKELEKESKNKNYKNAIKRLINTAESTRLQYDNPTVKEFREELGQMFAKAEKRTSGVYKRNAKGVSFLIGLVLAFVLNVDSFQIVDQLVKSPQLSLVYSNVAEQVFSKNNQAFDQLLEDCLKSNNSAAECEQKSQDFQKGLQTTLDSLEGSNISDVIGWSKNDQENWITYLMRTLSPLKILGWLISAIAMAMGAPFWFDLLGKVINVRNAGKSTDSSSSATGK